MYLVSIYVVILVIMVLRYAPRSYLVGLEANTEEEEQMDDPDGLAPKQSTVEETGGDWEAKEQGFDNEEILVRLPSERELDENDVDKDEQMDKVSSMRNASSHGLMADPEHPSRPKLQREASKRMLKSRSTGSLRASIRAQVPTFGE